LLLLERDKERRQRSAQPHHMCMKRAETGPHQSSQLVPESTVRAPQGRHPALRPFDRRLPSGYDRLLHTAHSLPEAPGRPVAPRQQGSACACAEAAQ